jgi:hypothetical protein
VVILGQRKETSMTAKAYARSISVDMVERTALVVIKREGETAPTGGTINGATVTVDFDYEPALEDTDASRVLSEAKQVLRDILDDWPIGA